MQLTVKDIYFCTVREMPLQSPAEARTTISGKTVYRLLIRHIIEGKAWSTFNTRTPNRKSAQMNLTAHLDCSPLLSCGLTVLIELMAAFENRHIDPRDRHLICTYPAQEIPP
jgi:hypothetical protein